MLVCDSVLVCVVFRAFFGPVVFGGLHNHVLDLGNVGYAFGVGIYSYGLRRGIFLN